MANLVVSGIGAAAGYMIGGPTGAQIGWMIGSYLSADKVDLGQPTVGDLRVQTSSYGGIIPTVVGTQRVAGNVIWTREKTPYTFGGSSGGKGGKPATPASTGYKITQAIHICKGPILGIRKVWADGELIVDGTPGSTPLIGTLYLGTNTQLPDPTIQSFKGAGNVPAYLGHAYIVLKDFDLGIQGRVPMFSFEVIKEGGI